MSEAPRAGASPTAASAGSALSHELFLSYAHEDRERAEELAASLRRDGYSVWWDDELRAGDQWAVSIQAAIERTSLAVLVLWSQASVRSNPVLAEADLAIELGLYFPVRIDDVALPLFFRLYEARDLRARDLASYQELLTQLDELRGIERPEPTPDLTPESVPPPTSQLARVSSRPPGINLPYLVRRTTGVVLVVSTALFLLYGTGLVDRVAGTDTKLRFASAWIRSLVQSHEEPSPITFVSVGRETIDRFGSFGASYRSLHAELVRSAGRHGATAIAFDVYFPASLVPGDSNGTTAAGAAISDTGALAEAIAEVRAAGTAVVIGEKEPGKTAPRIRDALSREAPGLGYVANICIGLRDSFAVSAPLLVATRKGDNLQNPVLSLALASFAAFVGADALRPMLTPGDCCIRMARRGGAVEPQVVRISGLDELRDTDLEACPYLDARSDAVATLIVDLPPQARYRADAPNVIEYAKVIDLVRREQRGASEAERTAAARELAPRFSSRLVLVGPRVPGEDVFPVFGRRGSTWGSELHAHAIETLLAGRSLELLSPRSHLALIALTGLLGASLRLYYRRDVKRRRVALGLLLGANAFGIFAAAVWADLLIDGVYQALAAVLAYLACGRYISPFSASVVARAAS